MANYRDYEQIATDNSNPEIIQQRKDRAKALKLLQANTKAEAEKQWKADVAKEKTDSKVLEILRVQGLTREELAEEKEVKKFVLAAKKEAKANQLRIDIATAQLLLGHTGV